MINRRSVMSGLLGCSAAAHPMFTPVAFADGGDQRRLGDKRLVVIVLRGGMDGMDALRPVGDPDFAAMRPKLAHGGQALTDFYDLHPALDGLRPLWDAGDLAFANAVSTPYRDKRSHFDGQEILEAGTPGLRDAPRDGWLNRMLQTMPGTRGDAAYSLGLDHMLLMAGAAPVNNWAPDIGVNLSPQGQRLIELVMHDDPLFQSAASEAMEILTSLSQSQTVETDPSGEDVMMGPARRGSGARVAEFAANRLRGDSRIAAFSLNGWDTHRGQKGQITRGFNTLSNVILRLQAGLGPVWDQTCVIAMTEFGRTVRENGTGGTDHGTGGLAVLAGGAVRGGVVHGQWPGLASGNLYQDRDLMPTSDVRAYAAWALAGLYGVPQTALETVVFPGLQLGRDPGVLL